jgi:hypothetical protein
MRSARIAAINLLRQSLLEKRRDETAAHQTVMRGRFVEVECAGDGHDRFQVRRPLHGSFHLCSGEIADPNHADIAVRPGLLRGPLNKVVHVATFLAIKETKGAARPACFPAIRNEVDVTTGHEEIAGASFNEARRRAKVLDLPRIGGGGHPHGIPTWFCRTMHVRQQIDAIAHADTNILVLTHEVGRLRQIAIFAARGLRSVGRR